MNWAALGVGVAIITAVVAVAMLAMAETFRKKFVSKEEFEGQGKRLDGQDKANSLELTELSSHVDSLDTSMSDLKAQVLVMQERQMQQWERTSDNMKSVAQSVDNASKRLEEVMRMVDALARHVNYGIGK